MAFTCKITDGTDEVDLYYNAALGFSLLDEGIKPGLPESRILFGGLAEDKLVRKQEGKRTIPLELYVKGSSDDDLINRINTLERLVRQASDFHLLDFGDEVFLEFKLSAATNTTRFPVLSGTVDTDRIMSLFCKNVQVVDRVPVVLTCKPYWISSSYVDLENLLDNPGFAEWNAGAVDKEPDGWTDAESLAAGTGTNNQESTEVKVGDYSLKTVVSGINQNDYKGVYQNIFARITADTEYSLEVWVKNSAITNGEIRVYAVGDSSGTSYALQSGAANSDFTQHTCQFTPDGSDTYLRIYVLIYGTSNGCSGTIYVDRMRVLEGSTVPDAWMSSSFIKNHYDTGALDINYIDVVDIPGEMPALARIDAYNNYNSARAVKVLRIAQRVRESSVFSRARAVLEYEDADYYAGGPVGTPDAGSSGGNYGAYSGLAATTWTTIAAWHIDPSDIEEWGGAFKIIGRSGSGGWPATGYWRIVVASLADAASETGRSQVGTGTGFDLFNFGNFHLPPWSQDSGDPGEFRVLFQYRVDSGTTSINLDCLFVLPVDAYQVLHYVSYNCIYTASIYIDGVKETAYDLNSGERMYLLGHVGDFIKLQHRDEQRLFFLASNDQEGSLIARTWKITLSYRLWGVHLQGTE